jgi:Family of unknown function (DUF6325)
MAIGPVQIMVLDLGEGEPTGEGLAELARLEAHDVVRLIDMVIVRRHEGGAVELIDVEAAPGGGKTVTVLAGLVSENGGGPPEASDASGEAADAWYVLDTIPEGTTVAVALLEHRWAIGLRDALRGRGGRLLAEAWVHPLDLVAVGLAEPDDVEG